MCFSATASFVGAGVITAAGVGTLALVRDVRQLPFAALPLLFGLHQFTEGWTWLELGDQTDACLTGPGVHTWVLFAWALLPFFVPWAAWLMEPPGRRRSLIAVPFAVGTALALYLLYLSVQPGIRVEVVDGNLDYHMGIGYSPAWLAVPYVFATCLAPMLSRHRYVFAMGLGNLIAMTAAALLNAAGFASLWCTFAAFLSLIVLVHFIIEYRHHREEPPAAVATG
ncbi:DUF6629 family protein [Gordonia sp. VNK21]|uniref:DUF6629 family protein n=1 Tax=Gordonia sp. VNK21 TaxID=3382483 RepID=UPI0038D3AEFE